MTQYLSTKLKVVSLALMLMVVMLHSYNIDIKQGGQVLQLPKDFNWALQNFFSNGIARVAVPLFFIISGYLFVSVPNLTIGSLWVKIRKRFRTLVIPYFFWALAGILLYYILQSIPASQPFFTKKLIKNYNVQDWLQALFTNPIPYQLWFLRDLAVMVILSPVLYYAMRYLRILLLVILFPFWICNQDTVFLTTEALLFFSTGLYLGEKQYRLEIQQKYGWALITGWLVLLAGFLIFKYNELALPQLLFYKMAILTGIAAFWCLYDKLYSYNPRFTGFMSRFTWLSFFIYAFHEPMLTIVKKGLFAFMPKTPAYYFVVYITAPIIIILVSSITAWLIRKCMPALYGFITGNR